MPSLGSVVLYGQIKREMIKIHFHKWDHESVSETHLTKGLSTRPQCLRLMFEINQRNWNAIVYYWRMCISNRELSMGDPFDTIVYIFMQINENFINKNKNKYNRCNEKYYLQRRLEQSQRHKRNKTKQRSLNRIKKINKVILYKLQRTLLFKTKF